MFDPATDPSGNSLRARASQHRTQFDQDAQENARQHGQLVGFGQLGPLPDPMWEGLFQAMDERGVDKVAGASPSPGERYQGLPESTAGLGQSTFDPRFQQSARQSQGQLGQNPYMSGPLGGLQDAGAGLGQGHDAWMTANPAAKKYRGVQ